jgi:cytochrome c553
MKRTSLLTSAMLALAALLASSAHAADVKGDAQAGSKKVSMCMGCHNIPGYQGSFPEVYKVPMLGGQNARYIAAALNEYKKGDRKHPTMRGIAGSLSEQDIADVAAYYEQQAKENVPEQVAQPQSEVKQLLDKGGCIGCHGANFSKPTAAAADAPKLAGQHPDYLFAALKAYQTDNNPQVGRNNPIMAGMVKQFSHAELKAIAQYISTLPSELRTVPESRFR